MPHGLMPTVDAKFLAPNLQRLNMKTAINLGNGAGVAPDLPAERQKIAR